MKQAKSHMYFPQVSCLIELHYVASQLLVTYHSRHKISLPRKLKKIPNFERRNYFKFARSFSWKMPIVSYSYFHEFLSNLKLIGEFVS